MTNLSSRAHGRANLTLPVVFTSLLAILAWSGCGEEQAPADAPPVGDAQPEVVLEIEAPATEEGAAITSVDYEIACDTAWDTLDDAGEFVTATRRSGTLELAGPARTASGDVRDDANLWSAVEAPLEGLCLLSLIGRDEQQQSICASASTFGAIAGQSDQVSAVMACLERAQFIGDLFAGAETPDVVGSLELQTVEFTVACEGRGTAFFEGMADDKSAIQLNGNLEVVQEPGRLNVQNSFLDLPVGACTLQLRARDEDNEVRCTDTEAFIIAPNRTTDVDMVVTCDL